MYQPNDAMNGSWYSPMNGNTDKFDGMNTLSGVNPANGMVLYYELPKLSDSTAITMDILDASGKLFEAFLRKRTRITNHIMEEVQDLHQSYQKKKD